MKKNILYLLLFVLCACSSSQDVQVLSPFGVCAHLQSGSEHRQMPANLQMMYEAGIRWVRVDFSWSGIESPRGNWNFAHIDKVVEETEKTGLSISALLLYNVAWANPAYQHLDLWLKYVEKTVTRYKDRVRYWEVWNEPNLFWENPNGADYAKLLEATYRKIKEIDPELTVLYGGTSGIPMKFLEESLKAGAGAFFDVVNIHPYRGRMNTMENWIHYQEDLAELQKLMDQYHIGDKKIWITEMGWSTWTTLQASTKDAFDLERKRMKQSGKKCVFAVLFDKTYQTDPNLSVESIQSWFSEGDEVEYIQIADLRTADLLRYQALFVPPWEDYEAGWIFDAIIPNVFSYLHKGGKVFFYGDGAITESEQASYLAQSILFSLRLGIERFFWYEFQSPEDSPFDREAHFGLVSRRLESKPAYLAYTTLTRVFPEGSVVDKSLTWTGQGFCQIRWRQKDGTYVWAVWSPDRKREFGVKIGRGFQCTLDQFGNKLPVNRQTDILSVGQEITYIIGSKNITFMQR